MSRQPLEKMQDRSPDHDSSSSSDRPRDISPGQAHPFLIEAFVGAEEGGAWPEKILSAAYLVGLVVGLLLFFPIILPLSHSGQWPLAVVDAAAMIWALAVLISGRRIPLAWRKNGLLLSMFLIGGLVFYFRGPFSGGLIWLFTFTVFSGILSGPRAVVAAVALNTCLLALMGWQVASHDLAWAHAWEEPVGRWWLLSLVFSALSILVALSLTFLTRGLNRAVDREKAGRVGLLREHRDLALYNLSLHHESEERKRLEILMRLERDVAAQVSLAGSVEEALDQALKAGFQVEGVDWGAMFLVRSRAEKWVLVSHREVSDRFIARQARLDSGEDPGRWLPIEGPTHWGPDAPGPFWKKLREEEGLKMLSIFPVLVDRQVRAAMLWGSRNRPELSSESRAALEFFALQVGHLGSRLEMEWYLKESEARYRVLFSDMPDGVLLADIETRKFLFANPAICRFLGYSAEELLTMSVGDIHPATHLPRVLAEFESLTLSLKNEPVEVPCLTKDGQTVWAEISASPTVMEGQPCLLGFFRDISEKRLAQEKLDRTEALLKAAIEQSPAGIVVVDAPDLSVRLVNSSALSILGLDAEDLNVLSDFHTPGKWKAFEPDGSPLPPTELPLSKTIRQARPVRNREIIVRRSDGESRFTLSNASPVFDRQGEITAGVLVFLDITDRHLTEEALLESERRFKEMTELLPETIYEMDALGRLTYVNQSAFEKFGYAPEDMEKGLWGMDMVAAEDRERARKTMWEVMSGRPTGLNEYLAVKKDGTRFPAIFHSAPIVRDGRVVGLRGFIIDITDPKRTAEERDRLATAIEQAAEDIVITDVHGFIRYVNPAFERVTGYDREEAVGADIRLLESAWEEEGLSEAQSEALSQGQVWRGRVTNRRKDGQAITLEAAISPIRDSKGQLTGFVAVRRDVTEQLKMEAQLAQTQKMEAIGTMAGGIAHDFNNILSIIVGHAEIASLMLPQEDPIRPQIRQVLKAAGRATDLVQRILTFSRQAEQEFKPLDLGELVRESLNFMRATLPSTIELQSFLDPDPAPVLVDPTQIHQVLMNLCNNAAHSMTHQRGLLTISLDRKFPPGPEAPGRNSIGSGTFWRLAVKDNGCGMPAEILDRIFEPFFTTKSLGEGTGLGLAVVHGIVQSHGGTIEVASTPGQGTTFKIYLPYHQGPLEWVTENEVAPAKGEGRILLIDDEPDILKVGRDILEYLGYQVTTLESSCEALTMFQKKPNDFDLIITDQTMPGLTGEGLAKVCLEVRPDIPIILCTGFSQQVSAEALSEMGIRRFVMKPLTIKKIADTIREVLPLKEADPALNRKGENREINSWPSDSH